MCIMTPKQHVYRWKLDSTACKTGLKRDRSADKQDINLRLMISEAAILDLEVGVGEM